jgi:hypothetical protein
MAVMTQRTAACHCGAVQLACEGEPARISMCHCLDCQRRTGSLFSIAVFYGRDAVKVTAGATRTFTRDSASGQPVTFHFCEVCGSNLFWEPRRLPDRIGVAAGAFADPGFPRPEQAVWVQDRHEWLPLPAELPVHARNPMRGPPTD